MNILSLFDGMSCGQQALERAGIKVDNYYASEIDKHAISITQKNYPNTVQLGSVVNVDVHALDKIDLLIGGSPCQSFSFAGKRKGMRTKEFPNFSAPTVQEWEEYLLDENNVYFEYSDYCDVLFERYERKCASLTKETIEILSLNQYLELKEQDFEFDGQSYLFWEYMRILTDLRKVNPEIKFLLENVMMGEKWEKVLSRAIGVNPIEINSSLVSAQNRRRLYWTNIGMKPSGLFGDLESVIIQPKDKGILLKDILESEVDEKYFLSDARINTIAKSSRKVEHLTNDSEKHNCLIAGYAKNPTDGQYIVHNLMPRSSTNGNGGTGHLTRNDGKTYCLDTASSIAVELQCKFGFDTCANTSQNFCDSCEDGDNYELKESTSRIRRLTPTECERLQTVRDGYTEGVSDTQRYRMLGNGWTVEVIAHIFNYLNN